MRLHLIEQRVNNDSALINRGRWVTLTFTLGVGEVDYLITIKSGRIVKICKRDIQTLTGVFSIERAKTVGTNIGRLFHQEIITTFLRC